MDPKTLANKAGFKTVTALAEALKISVPSIFQWKKVPPKRAVQIEKISGGKVTRQELRPDLYEGAP